MQNKVNVGSLYMDLKRGDKTGGITSSNQNHICLDNNKPKQSLNVFIIC